MTSVHPAVSPPPRWAVACAWLVPLAVLPSAIWRTSAVVTDPAGFFRATADGGWYLLLLSVASVALGFMTIGLVRPWGVVYPRWIPLVGGQRIPVRAVARIAVTGGAVLIALTVWFFVFNVTRPFEMPVLILADQPARPAPEWPILRWYLPAIAWGPLVIAVARDYRRRCAKSLLECPAAVGSR
jgi:hypothetical protein